MKITNLKVWRFKIPYTKPVLTATRRIDGVDDLVVTIETNSGLIGWGSASPSPLLTGESHGSMAYVLHHLVRPRLIGSEVFDLNHILEVVSRCVQGNFGAKSACDIALHDLVSQACGLPLYKFLGGEKGRINTGISIGLASSSEMAQSASEAVKRGFNCLKVKLGHANLAADIDALMDVRQAVGPDIRVAIDCNQAWSRSSALFVLDALSHKHVSLSMIEQPVAANDVQAMRIVREKATCPVFADEGCFVLSDLITLHNAGALDGVVIKLMKCGGLRAAITMYEVARSLNLQVAISCIAESPISISAMAAFGASRKIDWVDLDSIASLASNPLSESLVLNNNEIQLSDRPGLGIRAIPGLDPVIF